MQLHQKLISCISQWGCNKLTLNMKFQNSCLSKMSLEFGNELLINVIIVATWTLEDASALKC